MNCRYKDTEVMSGSFEDYLPPEMAKKGEEIGVKKANLDFTSMFALAVLAGAFISLGAIFATVVLTTLDAEVPWGWVRLVGGLVFSLGLILVIVGGAELFTGNNLIIMAWASRRLATRKVLRSWGIVYLGNFLGAVATAVMVFMANGAVGQTALNIALGKGESGFLRSGDAGGSL